MLNIALILQRTLARVKTRVNDVGDDWQGQLDSTIDNHSMPPTLEKHHDEVDRCAGRWGCV